MSVPLSPITPLEGEMPFRAEGGGNSRQILSQEFCRHPPLCHFVTSPPQGGRSLDCSLSHGLPKGSNPARSHANKVQKLPHSPISPLEGEMPFRAEGGENSRQFRHSEFCRFTPLCHCVTSPPQGGRLPERELSNGPL